MTLRSTPRAAIAVVKVQSPWYATRALLARAFRNAVPEYQAVPGLARKQFSIAADGAFGGIYLFRDRKDAEQWFGPAWHQRVREKRGVDGEVRIVDVARALDGPVKVPAFEGPMVVALAPDTLERYAGAKGLRAAYEGEGKVISTWQDRVSAAAFLGGAQGVEWFDTPIGLVNE